MKTGSCSVTEVLIRHFDAIIIGPRHRLIYAPQFRGFHLFATIRNPFQRFLSAWNYFQNFTLENAEERLPSMHEELCHYPIQHFVKFETLEEDFNKLPFVNSPLAMPHLNRSEIVETSLTIEMADFVRSRYRRDFTAYGYSTEYPVPDLNRWSPA